MGLLDFIARRRRAREAVMPDPESPEFQETVAASELPGSSGTAGVAPDEWKSVAPPPSKVRDPRGTDPA
jgi:hypothetical protein